MLLHGTANRRSWVQSPELQKPKPKPKNKPFIYAIYVFVQKCWISFKMLYLCWVRLGKPVLVSYLSWENELHQGWPESSEDQSAPSGQKGSGASYDLRRWKPWNLNQERTLGIVPVTRLPCWGFPLPAPLCLFHRFLHMEAFPGTHSIVKRSGTRNFMVCRSPAWDPPPWRSCLCALTRGPRLQAWGLPRTPFLDALLDQCTDPLCRVFFKFLKTVVCVWKLP